MKSPSISLSLVLLPALPHLTQAWFECSRSNSVPLSSLFAASDSSSGLTGGLSTGVNIPPPTSPGCSFYIAAGGTCTTTKSKRSNSNGDNNDVLQRRATYSTLPCLDSMRCVTSTSGQLGCVDLVTGSSIDDTGACYDAVKGEKDENCVGDFLKERSASGSATASGVEATAAAKASGTAAAVGATSTATSLSTKGGVASVGVSNSAAGSFVGLFAMVAGLWVV